MNFYKIIGFDLFIFAVESSNIDVEKCDYCRTNKKWKIIGQSFANSELFILLKCLIRIASLFSTIPHYVFFFSLLHLSFLHWRCFPSCFLQGTLNSSRKQFLQYGFSHRKKIERAVTSSSVTARIKNYVCLLCKQII